ncbi:Uma2 family endonuclease [Microcoleus sp. FACHB-1515]|uniref:Uma2 family endonuclease n=1 Tax=Cyanophyceae TaxID=3028117 RepID=UPI0016866BD6|nr:Uma2 family endonuclease [Microcoleus sp. FACHB-1515]MBD2090709.1 Uma2 family endonuclease [Microcoleus sp. FACHB-1515]
MSGVITAKWTIEDYHRMIAAGILDDRQVELLNGEIVEMPPEGTPHAAYSQNAADYLRLLLGGRVRIREAKPVTLRPNDSEPEPDIAIVAPHSVAVYLQHHPYPEDIFWLIEYSDSSLKKDLEVKTQIYAAAGIREYWVINLKAKELIVFRSLKVAGTDSPTAAGYQSKQTFAGGSINPLAFPDVSVSVQQLFS